MSNPTEPEPATADRTETEPKKTTTEADESSSLDPVQQVGTVIVAVSLGLAVSQFLGLGVLDDSTLRILLFGGIVCLGGRETIKLLVAAFAP